MAEALEREKSESNRLESLLEKQVAILTRIDARQEAAASSNQPIPQVSERNPGTWMALLQSAKDHIDPHVDRWRSSMDALLVFIGLFSAIVTAFLVESSKDLLDEYLEPDVSVLLLNTHVRGAMSNNGTINDAQTSKAYLLLSQLRISSYWSLSLVLSLCVASLAISTRGYLLSLTRSTYQDSPRRVAEIWTRWTAAEKLAPAFVAAIPHLMAVPVFLFVIGLLEYILQLAVFFKPISLSLLFAFALSVSMTVFTLIVMLFFLFHSVIPPNSWFQMILSKGLPTSLINILSKINLDIDASSLRLAYHNIIQRTYQDGQLEEGASSALAVIKAQHTVRPNYLVQDSFSPIEVNTLLHLLSPEATVRNNITAANVIIEALPVVALQPGPDLKRIMRALVEATNRSIAAHGIMSLGTNELVAAVACLANPDIGGRAGQNRGNTPQLHILLSSTLYHHDKELHREAMSYAYNIMLSGLRSRSRELSAMLDSSAHTGVPSILLNEEFGNWLDSFHVLREGHLTVPLALRSLVYGPPRLESEALNSIPLLTGLTQRICQVNLIQSFTDFCEMLQDYHVRIDLQAGEIVVSMCYIATEMHAFLLLREADVSIDLMNKLLLFDSQLLSFIFPHYLEEKLPRQGICAAQLVSRVLRLLELLKARFPRSEDDLYNHGPLVSVIKDFVFRGGRPYHTRDSFLIDRLARVYSLQDILGEEVAHSDEFSNLLIDELPEGFERRFIGVHADELGFYHLPRYTEEDATEHTIYKPDIQHIVPYFVNHISRTCHIYVPRLEEDSIRCGESLENLAFEQA